MLDVVIHIGYFLVTVGIVSLKTYFVNELKKISDRVILASLGTPYLLMDFPDVSTYLCAYKGSSVMQNALYKALMGKENISGRLPISIPGMYEIGSGLFLEKRVDNPIVKKFEPGKLLLRVRSKTVNANISKIDQLMNQAIAESAWPCAGLISAKN